MNPSHLLLFAVLVLAVISDWRESKIPNRLTGPAIALGLLTAAVQGEFVVGITGLGAAFVLHFFLFALQIDRGGDAKLMMAVGAFLGWQEMVEATLYSFAFFLPVGLAVLWLRGRLGRFVAALRWTLLKAIGSPLAGPRPEPTMMIKAPAILAGTLLAMGTEYLSL